MVICKCSLTSGLRRRSVAARLLGLWVRIPSVAWMFVSCKCCVLSGRGLCDGPIPRLEESYCARVCVCVCVCVRARARVIECNQGEQ